MSDLEYKLIDESFYPNRILEVKHNTHNTSVELTVGIADDEDYDLARMDLSPKEVEELIKALNGQ